MIILAGCKSSKCPKFEDIKSIDQIKDMRNYDYLENGISYFECAKDKKKIIDVCKKTQSEDRCTFTLATIYIMYLYKTGEVKKYQVLDRLLLGWMKNRKDLPFDKDGIRDDIYNFLSDKNAKSNYLGELNLLKNINSNNIIKEVENDKYKYYYFKNILEYGKATKVEDCQNIKLMDEYSNVLNNLLKEACELTFTSDKVKYCEKLIMGEVKACEVTGVSEGT